MCKTVNLIVLLMLISIITFGSANAASVTTLNPDTNTHTAVYDTDLTATFDDNVDALSVNDTTFVVHRGFEDSPAGSFNVSGADITFNPTYDFYPGELIQTTITTDITLDGGTSLDSAYVWQFRTIVNSGSGFFVDNGEGYGSSSSTGISLGDLDGDGDLDAFVGNYDQANKVWLNDGDGTFTDSGESYGSSYSMCISLGDLDGDGDLDAFVANAGTATNKVWLNNGDGTFTDVGDYGSSNSFGISLGDLDGDGDLDAFVANNIGQANKVWLNNGDGTFTDGGSYGSSNSYDISLGDLDGDSDLDVFAANRNQANKVWLNDGDGTFTDSGESYGSSYSHNISLGDLDSDGDLDAFVANLDADKIWLNDGDGTFTDSGESYGSSWSDGISLGDLDGDGDLDVFVASYNGEANKVWLNDGHSNFTVLTEDYSSSDSRGISLGDLDGDGDLDAFVANYNNQTNKVWLNTLPSITTVTPTENTHNNALNSDLIVNFDMDINQGNIDTTSFVVHRNFKALVNGFYSTTSTSITFNPNNDFYPGELVQVTITDAIANPYIWQFRTIVNSGSAYFVDNGESYGSSWSYDMSLGDLDGDGDLDAGMANSNSQANKVWLNDGDGTFTAGGGYGSSNSFGISLGDLDGDGNLDAFVANSNSQANKVWLNNGNGTFTVSVEDYGSSDSRGISLVDLDGDGDLDAFVANSNSQANKVWLNDGDGTFTMSVEDYGSSSSYDISLGDLDGDGDLDAFVANLGQANKVWLNDGDGTFTDSGESYGSSDSYGISLGDLDGDGDLDAFVTNYSGQANKVWLNDGDGTFTMVAENYGSSNSYDINLGDLDGDGDLDAFVANGDSQANKVWLNDGDGTFTDSEESYGSSFSYSISLGDLDGDGDLEAFVANFGDANKVWLNNKPPTASNNIVGTYEDTNKVFSASEFNFADIDGDTLTQIQITTLETVGNLYLDKNNDGLIDGGEDIILNQIVTVDSIPKLKFKPIADGNGSPYDSYEFKVHDDIVYSDVSYTMTIIVIAINDTPVITGQVPLSTSEETELIITLDNLTVINIDGTYPDDFTLFIYDGVNYTHTDSSVTPIADFNDTLTVPVRVFDGADTSIVFNLEIIVTAVNDTPVITSTPPDSAMQGVLYTYQVIASDVDDDTLYYHLLIHPAGMTIDINTGLIEWTPADTNLGNYNISLEVTEPHSGAGTMQDYVLHVYSSTYIDLLKFLELPSEFDLSQNYPNPFNPNTEIHFALPYESSVKLNVYNVNGQLVKTLVYDNRNAGYYAVKWNGTDNHNREVASGMYIYRLSAGDYVETKKMLMLK